MPSADSAKAEPFRDAATELAKLDAAVKATEAQIQKIQKLALEKVGAKEAQIFEAHLMMLLDPEYLDGVRAEIGDSKITAAEAIANVTGTFVQVLSQASSPYLRERVADLKDVAGRLTRNLDPQAASFEITEPVILVAEDLAPSELISLSVLPVKGVALAKGGMTSHTAILLKSMGLPAVFGLNQLGEWPAGAGPAAVLDAEAGRLILEPDEKLRREYAERLERETAAAADLERWRKQKTVLKDGAKAPMHANVGSQKQLLEAIANGAEGVGLYRTEFLFMDRPKPPTEKEQFELYRAAVEGVAGRPLVIRTLDIGGDKKIPYLELPAEENPFLGVRGLRLCLKHRELFTTQLKALIAAAESGPIDVMFPMVTAPEELAETFALVKPLLEGKTAKLRWGMMLEVPVNLFMIPELSRFVEFFSVGTNDLTQYLTACDRMNTDLQALGDPYSPGVLRALAHLAGQVRTAGRELSVCGEMASDPLLIPFLIGIGVNKLSMNSLLIARNRRSAAGWSKVECEGLAQKVLQAPNREAILTILRSFGSLAH